LLASATEEGENEAKGKWKRKVEPPSTKTTYEGGISVGDKVPVHTKRGPKLQFIGFFALDPRGAMFVGQGASWFRDEDARLIADLWPELPGKPLAPGMRWKEHKEMSFGWANELIVELDVEVTSLAREAEGPVAMLRIRVDRTVGLDELHEESHAVASLSDKG